MIYAFFFLCYELHVYSDLDWIDAPRTMLPTIKKVIAKGIRIWLYR